MSFKDLGLPDFLLRALDDRGYDIPTEIQEKTIKAFSSGKHIVGQSQTGSGKTAAFVLPMLQAINTRQREPQVLMLAPTRELAAQIREEIFSLSKYMRMMSLCAVGGTSKRKQVRILRKGPQIVVGTPGRIEDLLDSHILKPGSIDYFILDEVDRMLDMGFIESIRRIWQRLDTVKQTMTFSATLPKEAKHLLSDFIGNDYTTIKISEEVVVDKVDHTFLNLQQYDKYAFLTELLNNNPDFKVLIFAETKRRVDQLASKLRGDGFSADSLHGDMDQRERFQTLNRIKKDECRILVATDVAARGLNMNAVQLVINYEVPTDPESYVHRIGRTARAGRSGNALTFVSSDEWDALHSIEKRNDIRIMQINKAGEPIERRDRPRANASSGRRYKKYSKHSNRKGGKRTRHHRARASR